MANCGYRETNNVSQQSIWSKRRLVYILLDMKPNAKKLCPTLVSHEHPFKIKMWLSNDMMIGLLDIIERIQTN